MLRFLSSLPHGRLRQFVGGGRCNDEEEPIRSTMESAPRTWTVPKDPQSDFITSVKLWLNKNQKSIESLTDQQLKDRTVLERKCINAKLKELHELEQALRPLEWVAESVWREAWKLGSFDFDDLYAMVGPDDVVFHAEDPPEDRHNLRSRLDLLLSLTLQASEIQDELSALIYHPAIEVNRPSPANNEVNRPSPANKPTPSVWALIIGIDNYQSPLRCAVADAEAMSQFLRDRLSVPQDHITLLLARSPDDYPIRRNMLSKLLGRPDKSYPTRRNILSQLWSLHKNNRIQYGDTIIVFYAGHGALYSSGGILGRDVRVKESDRDWKSFSKRNRIDLKQLNNIPSGPFIESIVPADRGQRDSDPRYPAGTRRVPDICDRELTAIFKITQQAKGPNILFIADCCHSARVARSSLDVTEWRIRTLPPLRTSDMEEMLLRAQWNIDKYLRSTDGISGIRSVMDVEWTPDLSSFVTLAACHRGQEAREHFTAKNGLFTGVLLDTLESDAVDKDTTFEGLIQLVVQKLRPWQVPVVHGDRKNLRLWFRED